MIAMIGMQWYDADPMKSLAKKIAAAMDYHEKKYGQRAPICLVNIKDAEGNDLAAIGKECNVVVRAVRIVSQSHLWLGEEKETSND